MPEGDASKIGTQGEQNSDHLNIMKRCFILWQVVLITMMALAIPVSDETNKKGRRGVPLAIFVRTRHSRHAFADSAGQAVSG